MIFSYETQGAITYLVCELEPMEILDTLTLGMLTNNHIAGVAPVLYTEMNGVRYLKYNISAKITSEQFFSGSINKDRLFNSLQNITSALCAADEYMIDQVCFSFQPEHVFLNVSSCEAALICVPVAVAKDVNSETTALFRRLLTSAQASPAEAGYVTKLLEFIDNPAVFNIYSFNDYLRQLRTEPVAPMSMSGAPARPFFDSTISIDDMPGLKSTPAQQPSIQPPVQPSIQPPVQPAIQPPVQPSIQPLVQPAMQPPVQQMRPAQPPVFTPPTPAQPPVNQGESGSFPGFNNAPAGQTGGTGFGGRPANVPPTPSPVTPPPAPRINPGFAIPGQSLGVPEAPGADDGKKKKKEKKEKEKKEKKEKVSKQSKTEVPTANAGGEKKMTLMNLMAHYNKENAALYKAQKEAAKQEKENAKVAAANTVPPVASPTNQFGFNPNGISSQGGMPPQGGMQSGGFVPSVQPLPVQNSFNETTVLSNFGGETTVLCESAVAVAMPSVLRIKTGEKTIINKPVFRIGKEKSYVDYFIADNTAISRSHANIHCENGEYFIEDTNSTNHTYVNGVIVSGNAKVKISNGDKIKLANEEFIFSL